MADILALLKGSDSPAEDQKRFLKAQILFWLIGATDGHAKNFSVFLGPGGRFHLAPIYDVLTAQPGLEGRQIARKHFKLAMSAGANRHYRLDEIQGRHFFQTAERAGLPPSIAEKALRETAADANSALSETVRQLPDGFPMEIHAAVQKGIEARLKRLF